MNPSLHVPKHDSKKWARIDTVTAAKIKLKDEENKGENFLEATEREKIGLLQQQQ